MRIIPADRIVLYLLCTVESDLLGMPSDQLQFAGPHFRTRHEKVDRLGGASDQAIDFVGDAMLGESDEAMVSRHVGRNVVEARFNVMLPDAEKLCDDGDWSVDNDGGESGLRESLVFPDQLCGEFRHRDRRLV
jgi:hypothetical protein